MKKLSIAFLCLLLFSACSHEKNEEQAGGTGRDLQLSVMNDTSTTQLPDSLLVYDWPEGTSLYTFYKFGPEGPIVLRDLEPIKHTILALANTNEMMVRYIDLWRMPNPEGSVVRIDWAWEMPLPDLIGGILYTNGSSTSGNMKMTRLVGGISVNILNLDQFPNAQSIEVVLLNSSRTSYIGETSIEFSNLNMLLTTDGKLNYFPPTNGPASGEIIVYDESYIPSVYRFVAQHAVEVNKKLELNLTLDKTPGSRAGNSAVICSEKVSNL